MTSIQTKAGEGGVQAILEENLYQSDKYKIHIGNGTVGFCTVWNEAKAALALAPELHNKAALVGTLYSSYGVNIIIRNLALNPFIRRLYVWGNGRLSNTKFGVMGSGVLKQLWTEGIQDDGSVPGTTFKVEQEIDLDVLRLMLQKVELIDVSEASLSEAVSGIKAETIEPYMAPVRFPDAVPVALDTFPSEEVGWVLRGRGVIDTWTRVVERIMRYGTIKGTQYGNQQKELIGLTWVVNSEDPDEPNLDVDWPEELRQSVGATSEAIKEYREVFMSPEKPEGLSYTYGNRLMQYPKGNSGETMDQVVDSLIQNLKNSPDTRRAVATTLVPWVDAYSDEPPCITQVQGLQAHGKLHFLVTVRSHDIFRAAIPNAFGLRAIQKQVAEATGLEMGKLQITSQSAHIYEQDWDNAKKLARCAFWERPVSKMYDAEDADPRGVFMIRVSGDKIMMDFNTKDGQPLLQLEGKSADHLALQIAQNELIGQSGHALDIGIQLARAEIALKKGIEFVQDRPLAI